MMGAFGAFILLGAAYLFFFNKNSTDSTITQTNTSTSASDAERVFLNLSSELGAISFDTKIFSNPNFTALTDIHTAVLIEAQGRHDPFATIGSQ